MVFFTCNGCGESLKKNKVDRHAYSCRNCEYVTCIDCSKDFWGDDYKTHNSCITEDEKYGATGFQKKMNKGDAKQQAWLEKIQDAANSGDLSRQGKELLETLLDYDNIPRKKAKFLNFLKNSLRIFNAKLGEEVWTVFSAPAKKEPDPATTETNQKKENELVNENRSGEGDVVENGKQNKKVKKSKTEKSSKKSKKEVLSEAGTNEESKKSKKSKKRKAMEEAANEGDEVTKTKKSKKSANPNHDPADESKDAVVAFPWNKTFRICVQSADGEISIKKLKKKVLAEYRNFQGEKEFRSESELEQLFTKKLNKSKKIKVEKTRVVLAKN